MLHLKRKIGPFTYHRIWFAQQTRLSWGLRFVSLRQFKGNKAPAFFVRKKFFTQLIDLVQDAEKILEGMSKHTSYQIRRAEKDGLSVTTSTDCAGFVRFFNVFAPSRGLSPLDVKAVESMNPNIIFTEVRASAEFGNALLAVHGYLFDVEDSRVRQLYSATMVREDSEDEAGTEPKVSNALIGRANRFLTFKDMVLAQEKGFRTFDFGGVAFNPDNEATQGIDEFKLGFGGTTVEQDHFDSFPLVLAQKLTRKGA